jgi:hypothetical protein
MDPLGWWELAVGILGEEVIFALNNDIRQHCPAIYTYTLDYRNPFLITRLLCTRSAPSIRGCYNLSLQEHSH